MIEFKTNRNVNRAAQSKKILPLNKRDKIIYL